MTTTIEKVSEIVLETGYRATATGVVRVSDEPEQEKYLREREAIIEKGLKSFLDVCRALSEIKSYKKGILYKETHGSFEKYCQDKWGFKRSYGYRLIQAHETWEHVNKVLTRGNKIEVPESHLPNNEAQLRELRKVPLKEQVKVWKTAIKKSGEKTVAAPLIQKLAEKANRRVIKRVNQDPAIQKPDIPSTPVRYWITKDDLEIAVAALDIVHTAFEEGDFSEEIINSLEEVKAALSRVQPSLRMA